MAVLENVDFSQAQEQGTFQPVPGGEYKLMVEATNIIPTKNNDNMLVMKFRVLEGQYKDREVSVSYNLWHRREQPRNIAISQFQSTFLSLMGRTPVQGEELDNMRFKTGVAVVESDGKYNNIKGWVNPNSTPSPQPPTSTPTPPWAKK